MSASEKDLILNLCKKVINEEVNLCEEAASEVCDGILCENCPFNNWCNESEYFKGIEIAKKYIEDHKQEKSVVNESNKYLVMDILHDANIRIETFDELMSIVELLRNNGWEVEYKEFLRQTPQCWDIDIAKGCNWVQFHRCLSANGELKDEYNIYLYASVNLQQYTIKCEDVFRLYEKWSVK